MLSLVEAERGVCFVFGVSDVFIVSEPDRSPGLSHIKGRILGAHVAVHAVHHILGVAFTAQPCLATVTLFSPSGAGHRTVGRPYQLALDVRASSPRHPAWRQRASSMNGRARYTGEGSEFTDLAGLPRKASALSLFTRCSG